MNEDDLSSGKKMIFLGTLVTDPQPNYQNHIVREISYMHMQQVTRYMWHMTRDTWNIKYDM